VKIRDSHVDTSRIVFDEALSERLAARTSPPDRNGCMFYDTGHSDGQSGKAIRCETVDGETGKWISVLRVAFWFAGRGHVTNDQQVGHVCRNNGMDGRPLCVAPDHLERQDRKEKVRIMHRAGHRARLAKSVGRAA
jgi:hypothetical protein